MITKLITPLTGKKKNTVYYGFSTESSSDLQDWGFDLTENSNYTTDVTTDTTTGLTYSNATDPIIVPFEALAILGQGLDVNDLYMSWIAFPKDYPAFPDYNYAKEDGPWDYMPISDNWRVSDINVSDFNNVDYTLIKFKGQQLLNGTYSGSIIVDNIFSTVDADANANGGIIGEIFT